MLAGTAHRVLFGVLSHGIVPEWYSGTIKKRLPCTYTEQSEPVDGLRCPLRATLLTTPRTYRVAMFVDPARRQDRRIGACKDDTLQRDNTEYFQRARWLVPAICK